MAAAAAVAPVAGCGSDCICCNLNADALIQTFDVAIDGGVPGTMLSPAQCDDLCVIGNPLSCSVVDGGGAVSCTVMVRPICGTGRRPAGLAEALPDGNDEVGNYFARAAHLEAASVIAFRRLAVELERQRAPSKLIEAARRSAADERRHARAMSALSRRWNVQPAPVVVTPFAERSLVDLAVENAVEGCVGETWGALLALWQAEAARDREVRDAMAAIAEDEIAHADLAWAISNWLEPFLDEKEHSRVIEARRAAVDALSMSIDQMVGESLTVEAGLPTPEKARVLFHPLREKLWS